VFGDVGAHEFPNNLRSRPVDQATRFQEIVPKAAFNPDPESCIFRRHEPSVTNGYTAKQNVEQFRIAVLLIGGAKDLLVRSLGRS
jgi:hypothetical protein